MRQSPIEAVNASVAALRHIGADVRTGAFTKDQQTLQREERYQRCSQRSDWQSETCVMNPIEITRLGLTVLAISSSVVQAQTQAPRNITPAAPPGLAISDFAVRDGDSRLKGQTIIPEASTAKPGDSGRRAHTNVRLFVPAKAEESQEAGIAAPKAAVGPPFSGFYIETPASLACLYALVTPIAGCNPNAVTANALGGSKVVAIVDAYDNPSILTDLQRFSAQFGLPSPTATNFQVVFAAGARPALDNGWALEEALDVEVVHALAPGAKIILVEAASNSYPDLMQAEDIASSMVTAAGGGEVSNSWGGAEFSGELSYASHFNGKTNVVFFASTGDAPGVSFPSTLPSVIAVGGTSVSRNVETGKFRQETTWADGGGGASAYVPRPPYQDGISGRVGDARGVPDISFDGNPNTGVWVYCGTSCGASDQGGWYIVGGTSVGSPAIAAMVNSAGGFAANSDIEHQKLYAHLGTASFFNVNLGVCGPYAGFFTVSTNAAKLWDFCTGLGSPRGLSGL